MPGATPSRTIAAVALATALALGCGDDKPKNDTIAPGPLTPNVEPTAKDLRIVKLVQETGGRLHIDAIRLFGDRVVLADKDELSAVADERLKIATRLERDSKDAGDKLKALSGDATAAVALAAAGKQAFAELAGCGRDAAAFFREVADGKPGDLGRPDAACKSARLAYGAAKTLADPLKR